MPLFIVGCIGGRFLFRLGLSHFQASSAIGFGFELGVLRGCEQMGVEELAAERGGDFFHGANGRMVLGDIAGGVPIDKTEVGSCLQLNRTHHQFLEGLIRSAWFPQREFIEAALRKCRTEKGAEFFELRSGHGLGV